MASFESIASGTADHPGGINSLIAGVAGLRPSQPWTERPCRSRASGPGERVVGTANVLLEPPQQATMRLPLAGTARTSAVTSLAFDKGHPGHDQAPHGAEGAPASQQWQA
jgi:hypothetical protein